MSHTKEPWAYGIVRDGKPIASETSYAVALHWIDAEIVPLVPMRERDELLAEVAKLKADLHEMRQRRHDEYRVRAIGKAVFRACEEMPEGFDLHIELEKGAGTVRLYDQEGDEVTEEFHGDYFNHAIDNAINFAIARVKGGAAC